MVIFHYKWWFSTINGDFQWVNPLFLWPCSIAFCMFTRPGTGNESHAPKKARWIHRGMDSNENNSSKTVYIIQYHHHHHHLSWAQGCIVLFIAHDRMTPSFWPWSRGCSGVITLAPLQKSGKLTWNRPRNRMPKKSSHKSSCRPL